MATKKKSVEMEKEKVDTNIVDETAKTSTKTTNKIATELLTEPLKDSDEIDVVSTIPNVSYKDNRTNDMYEWQEVGHIESMTFETLKNMWRNNKGYFRNMWLKPLDKRVIKQFGLTSTFEKYEYLMDESSYVRARISEICKVISSAPNGMKFSICNRIKALVYDGKITDIAVIKALGKELGLELSNLI